MIKYNKKEVFSALLFIFSPIIILLFHSVLTKRNDFFSLPLWSDEVNYWRELYSFDENLFSMKGPIFFGLPAKIGGFSTHGLAPLFAWGWYAILFKWNLNSIIIANSIMITFSFALFYFLVRPDYLKCVLLSMLTLFFAPLFCYIHSSMMEIPCYAAIISYIAFFIFYTRKPSKIRFVLLILSCFYVANLRIPYAILFIPAIFVFSDGRINLKFLIAGFAFVFFTLLLYKVQGFFTSGYPFGLAAKLNAASSYNEKIHLLIRNFYSNFKNLFSLKSEDFVQVSQRYFYFVVMLVLFMQAVRENNGKKVLYLISSVYFQLLLLLLLLLSANCLLYDVFDWRDYRTMSPFLFGVLFFLINKDGDKIIDGDFIVTVPLCALFMSFFIMLTIQPLKADRRTVRSFSKMETDISTIESASLITVINDVPFDMKIVSLLSSKITWEGCYNLKDAINGKRELILLNNDTDLMDNTEYGFILEIPNYGKVYRLKQ